MLEALIAEMLGDIGEVHRGIQVLSGAMPAIEAAIRDAAENAGVAFQAAVAGAIKELAEATRDERAAAAAAGEETSLAIKSISSVTTQMTINHKGTLDAHIVALAEQATANIGRRAGEILAGLKAEVESAGDAIKALTKASPGLSGSRPRLQLAGLLIAASLCGAAVGAGFSSLSSSRLSSDQVVAVQAGLDVERAFAVLDAQTREKVIDAIKRTSPKVDR